LANQTPLRGTDFSQEVTEKGWYHSFELPSGERIEGYNSIEILRARWEQFRLPEDLSGQRVLDIGAWDGWFTFEAERRGASVTSIDCVEIPNFLDIHRRLNSRADYRILDFYELPSAGLAPFDFVFFLGVLYHLKHPLLALEIVCALTTTTAIVDSFVIDPGSWQHHRGQVPVMEFYETDELGNQLDNWIGPSVECLMALSRASGFARVELRGIIGSHACLACHRQWEPPNPTAEPPELISVLNSRTFGINFSIRKEEYVAAWFRASGPVRRESLRLEIGPYGVPALYVKQQGDTWLANFRLAPGLSAGWHDVRLRFANSAFGRAQRIAVDMPVAASALSIREVADGSTWQPNQLDIKAGSHLACWVLGLPENADRANLRAWLNDVRLTVEHIGEPESAGARQVNVRVPSNSKRGTAVLRVECAGMQAQSSVSVI
jgi:tRNA (mo5U34)-methyltransferase